MSRRRTSTRKGRRALKRRRRAMTRRRLLRGIRIALGAAGVTAVGLGVFTLARTALPAMQDALRSPRFHLRAVHWVGLRSLDSAQLAGLLDLPERVALVDVDIDALASSVSRHARVARVDALRIPPDRIVLRIGEREPIARISGRAEGFDATGAHFPLLEGEKAQLVPVRGNPRGAIPLLLAARRWGVELAGVEVRSIEDVRFRVHGSDTVIRADGEADRALRAWTDLRAAGLVSRYQPEEVDLRFRESAVLRELRAKGGG